MASGLAMLFLADVVSDFLSKNRQYEVLGMFILLIVGVVLLGEGGHSAHLAFSGIMWSLCPRRPFTSPCRTGTR